MQYRNDKYGNAVSVLGYGCMRFSRTAAGGVDLKKAEREVLAAFRAGVNYYDTAYIYPGIEAALGEILARNGIRDQVNIATKLPHYMLKTAEDPERYFSEQLRRLKTDHVDYYLMHMLTDDRTWARLKTLGIIEWLAQKKAAGAIRQIGFSYHGNSDTFCRLIDAYDWDFCMIQYNYLDAHSQAGVTGLHYAHEKGLPVWIMEPLRGGRLVKNLPKEALRLFAEHPSHRHPAEWALQWLWDQPEVTCVLSGMNSMEMVEANVAAAARARAGSFSEADHALIAEVVRAINARTRVGCTGCRYCMPCPQGVDIPGAFSAYNRKYAENWFAGQKEYVMCTTLRKAPTVASNCVGCGKCERHCPQGIEIRKELQKVKKELEGPIYQIGSRLVKWKMKY